MWRRTATVISVVLADTYAVGILGASGGNPAEVQIAQGTSDASYVLCGHNSGISNAAQKSEDFAGTRSYGKQVRVYAASALCSGDRGLCTLQAALHVQGAVDVQHMQLGGRLDNAQVMTGMSKEDFANTSARRTRLDKYAKCFGAAPSSLGVDTVTCVTGKRTTHGRIKSYQSGTDLAGSAPFFNVARHYVVHCKLQVGQPAFSARLQTLIQFKAKRGKQNLIEEVNLELCFVKKRRRAVICSQTLYGLRDMLEERPRSLQDWLYFHRHLGFDAVVLYDVDGSFGVSQAALEYTKTGFVEYLSHWPAWISDELVEPTRDFPLCTETYAYSHCLVTQRAMSDWVWLIHAPDEYLNIQVSPGQMHTNMLDIVLDRVDKEYFAEMKVMTRAFAPLHVTQRSGLSLLAEMQWRSGKDDPIRLSPLLNPRLCTCAAPHKCVDVDGKDNLHRGWFDSKEVVVHHYVELLERDAGRCAQFSFGSPCDIHDDSLLWADDLLRRQDRLQEQRNDL